MPKRKREAREGDGRNGSVKHVRADASFERGQTLLFRAFKAAKGFERQKLSRRTKTATAQKNDTELTRINSEIEALRLLDVNKVAANYLRKSLFKIKAVAEAPDLPAILTIPLTQASDPASLNVIARLCNSNPVKDALPAIVTDVQDALGLAKRKTNTQSIPQMSGPLSSKGGPPREVLLDPDEIDSDGTDSNEDDTKLNGSFASDDDFADFDARLASSESDDDGDIPDKPKFDHRLLLKAHGSDSEAEDSEQDIELDSGSEQDDMAKGRASRRSEHRASTSPSASPSPPPQDRRQKKHTTSAFVPTLTMGGYISGSESDDPDADLDNDERKKNRRGQRARRAIWEKKYGAGAKHVRDDTAGTGRNKGASGGGAGKSRDQGWDPKRGATDGGGGGRRAGGQGWRNGGKAAVGRGSKGPSGANSVAVEPKKALPKHRDDDGKLHPSWEAAKRRKEAGAATPATATFKGKKITFD